MTTIFGKIIAGELPAKKVYEDEDILVIEDIHPIANVHLLLIPKEEFHSIQHVPKNKLHILTKVFEVAQKLASQLEIEDNYRIVTNNGKEAGQTIFHLHFHLIGGEPLGPMA